MITPTLFRQPEAEDFFLLNIGIELPEENASRDGNRQHHHDKEIHKRSKVREQQSGQLKNCEKLRGRGVLLPARIPASLSWSVPELGRLRWKVLKIQFRIGNPKAGYFDLEFFRTAFEVFP